MVKRYLAAMLITAAVGTANAADMPTKAPVAPVYAAPFNWAGFYVGAHVGWGWSTTEWSDHPTGVAIASHNLNGFLGGGQIGYNWQSGWAVFGVEADASWADIRGSSPCLEFECGSKIDAFGTITARFGSAVDHALVYVKGGGAWAHEKHTVSFEGVNNDSASKTSWGWTVGAGVEYAFAPNWSGKVEYNFLDFGKDTFAFADGPTDVRQTVHTVKFGINYRFGATRY